MIDFQAIHERHLQVFRHYRARRQEIVAPVRKASARLSQVRRVTVLVNEHRLTNSSMLPMSLIGMRINMLV